MGKDSEILEATRAGNFELVEKLLIQKAKKTGPLARLGEKCFLFIAFSLFSIFFVFHTV